jgi:hypothetical protein
VGKKTTIMNLFQFKDEDENMPMSGIHVLGLVMDN